MRSPAIRALSVAFCVACSQQHEPQAPLARYSQLKCMSLQASYDGHLEGTFESEAPTAVDRTLGWDDKLEGLAGKCVAPTAANVRFCRWVAKTVLRYTEFQERPLDMLGADEAFRAVYDHSLGAAVLVRAVRVRGEAFLVAKVVGRGGGPLAWITTRQLSTAEWAALQQAAAGLPAGRREYFPDRAQEFRGTSALHCIGQDGADVQVEHFQNGILQVARGDYEWPQPEACEGPCCAPDHEALSRFFDHLSSLVECPRATPPQ